MTREEIRTRLKLTGNQGKATALTPEESIEIVRWLDEKVGLDGDLGLGYLVRETNMWSGYRPHHNHFDHVVLHIAKTAGKLAAIAEARQHDPPRDATNNLTGPLLADLVLLAVRCAKIQSLNLPAETRARAEVTGQLTDHATD